MSRLHKHQLDKLLSRPDAELDLHGLTRAEARPELEQFLDEAERRGWRNVRIIVGKGWNSPDGQGILPGFVTSILEDRGYAYSRARQNEGGSGVLVVTIP